MEKRKLKCLSVQDKLKLLEEVDKGRKKKKEIAAQFGIPASTLSTILKHRVVLKQNVDSNNKFNPAKKRFSKCVFEDVDKCVLQWTKSMLNRNVQLAGDTVRQKARHFAVSLGHNKFRASTGWLEKFKERHRILQKNGKDNLKKCEVGDLPSSSENKSVEGGRSMTGHMGNGLVNSECPENVGTSDYMKIECDVLDNIRTIKIERESTSENDDYCIKEDYLPVEDDEIQIAIQTIRRYLNCKETVPDYIHNYLSAIEDYYEQERLNKNE